MGGIKTGSAGKASPIFEGVEANEQRRMFEVQRRGSCGLPGGGCNNGSTPSSPPQPSSVKSVRAERLMRTSLDLELDLQATRTWHSQLTQEISVLKEFKEQLEQAKSHGEKELPQWLREDERFRLLLRMLEKRVSEA